MKKIHKRGVHFFSHLVFGILYVPLGVANSAANNPISKNLSDSSKIYKLVDENSNWVPSGISVYDSLHLALRGLNKEAFEYAQMGFEKLIDQGAEINNSIITIIDFSQPSSHKRLFVLDLRNYKLLFNTLVAHGRNTGKEMANYFSNQAESYKSSPGFFITKETYLGNNGYSLKLEGIERGINDNAYERGIVIHGADYVSQTLVNAQGYIGRSQGCPAIPEKMTYPVINTIKGGSMVFFYHPSYISKSKLLE